MLKNKYYCKHKKISTVSTAYKQQNKEELKRKHTYTLSDDSNGCTFAFVVFLICNYCVVYT